MARTSPTCSAAPVTTLTRFYGGPNAPIFPSSNRRSLISQSISSPPKQSALLFPRRSSCAPRRSSNDGHTDAPPVRSLPPRHLGRGLAAGGEGAAAKGAGGRIPERRIG